MKEPQIEKVISVIESCDKVEQVDTCRDWVSIIAMDSEEQGALNETCNIQERKLIEDMQLKPCKGDL